MLKPETVEPRSSQRFSPPTVYMHMYQNFNVIITVLPSHGKSLTGEVQHGFENLESADCNQETIAGSVNKCCTRGI